MATFNDLPTHLIHQITSHIHHKQTLVSLTTTSTLLKSAAEPHLYSSYTNKLPSSNGDTYISHPSLISFTRTILLNRHLAQHVKHLDLGQWITTHDTDLFEPVPPLSEADTYLFLRCGASLELTDNIDESEGFTDNWPLAIHSGTEDAIIRLLIAHLPNLTTLSIVLGEGPVPSWTFIRRMARTPSAYPHGCLSQLHTLTATHDPTDGTGLSLGRLSGFFELPSLTTVHCQGWIEEDDPVHNWTCTPGSSCIQHLHLSHCALNEVSLRLLLDATHQLKSFRYSSSPAGTQQFTPRALRRALLPHRDTIEVLELELHSHHWEDFALNAEEYRLGSLQRYASLRTLDVEEYILLGHGEWYEDNEPRPLLAEVLPKGLRRLTIRDAGVQTKAALVELAGVCRASFPALMDLEVVFEDERELDQATAVLQTVFALQDVHLKVNWIS